MKSFNLYEDEQLMREIKADNRSAFDILYRKYCKDLYGFTISILKSREESENLIQDVFVSLWMNRYNVKIDSSIKSYIFTITYNSAITLIRKKVKEAQFIERLKSIQETHEEPVNKKVEFIELENILKKVIESLPQRQKEVYVLHNVEGRKYYEIAERLKISIKTVEVHIVHANKLIRKRMEAYH